MIVKIQIIEKDIQYCLFPVITKYDYNSRPSMHKQVNVDIYLNMLQEYLMWQQRNKNSTGRFLPPIRHETLILLLSERRFKLP